MKKAISCRSFYMHKPVVRIIFLFVLSFWGIKGCHTTKQEVRIAAHRGGMSAAPENTMAAFRQSVAMGVDILEVDLRTSSDGQLFILHDEQLDRTTDTTGIATELTMDELRQLDAGAWFESSYSGERIPSFQEVLTWAAGEEAMLLLDLKETGRQYAERVAGNIRTHDMEERTVIGVRSPKQAVNFRELIPEARQLGFIGSPDDIEEFASAGVEIIRLWLQWLEADPSLKDRVRDAGKKLMINGTVGEPAEARAIMKHAPDWILIDDPVQLKESLNATED